jgi:hypothetical protein
MNYHNRKFRPISNTENGDTSSDTIFEYCQKGNILTSTYSGGKIISGHLLAIVDDMGHINMRYHHLNIDGEMMTGVCNSTPEVMPNGKLRLHEKWKWTSGDFSEGESTLEEI